MEYVFIPELLKKAKDDIVKKHSMRMSPETFKEENKGLQRLIERIARLSGNRIAKEAQRLTSSEIEMIVRYIPNNYYSVNLKNLFQIISDRMTEGLGEIFYREWQDSYIHKDCNELICSELLKKSEAFVNVLKKYHISAELFGTLVQKGDIARKFGGKIYHSEFEEKKSFQEKLSYYGIDEQSRLYHDAEFLFYTYCKKSDYLAIDIRFLTDIVKKYDGNQVRCFLSNFLGKMSYAELERYGEMATYFQKKIGNKKGDKYQSCFKNFAPKLVEVYDDWMNIQKINLLFGDGERSMFWKQYKIKDVVDYHTQEAVLMYYDNYVAIDFLRTEKGPIYIYEKSYFDEKIKMKFQNRLSDSVIKSYLYHGTDCTVRGYRKTHQGDWQYDVNQYLLSKNITSRIDI